MNIIQNSTLAQAIGGVEILQAAKSQVGAADVLPARRASARSTPFEIFAGVMVLFFVISFPLTRLAAYLEKRLV